MKKLQLSLSVAAALFLGSIPALAATETEKVTTVGGATGYDGDIQTHDLLTGSTITSTVAVDAGSLSGFTDGKGSASDVAGAGVAYFGNGVVGTALAKDPVVTFTLNTSVATGSPLGYDLTSITSIYGWNNYPSMTDQDYTVSYSTVAAPTVFMTLYSVLYNPYPATNSQSVADASEVNLTNLTGADGVGALRFSFVVDGTQAGQMIQEIDVDGTPVAATPEPSTWALMGLGGLVLFWRLRRKLSA